MSCARSHSPHCHGRSFCPRTRLQCPVIHKQPTRSQFIPREGEMPLPQTSPGTWITGLALRGKSTCLTLATRPDRLNFSDAVTFQLSGMDKGRKMLEMPVMIRAQVPVARGIYPIEERMYEAWRRYGRSLLEMVLKIGTKLLHNLGSEAAVIDCMALSLGGTKAGFGRGGHGERHGGPGHGGIVMGWTS